jgi:DNA mismatch repair protein MutS
MAVREWNDRVIFLHKVQPGTADKSYGIHVARIAGVPAEVIKRSREILTQLENGNFLKKMPTEQMEFFKPEEWVGQDSVVERLKEINPDNISPQEALALLYELVKKIRAE